MKNNNVAFFLPTRKGSERVKNKNTRDFAGIKGGLLAVKLKQLLEFPLQIPIIISTNDPETIHIANSFNSDLIQIKERPEELCLSSTVIEDFINYIPSVVDSEHIFWVHTTTPFLTTSDYVEALEKYFQMLETKEYDSLLSVTKIQQFLWDPQINTFINHDRNIVKWPRTQDLKPIFEINHAYYINSRANYLKYHDRIGIKPYLYELNKIQSFDIDWEEDFELAEILYEKFSK